MLFVWSNLVDQGIDPHSAWMLTAAILLGPHQGQKEDRQWQRRRRRAA